MHLSEALAAWYLEHKRDLPWRRTTDPYVIWLSEVILQQTRVDQGLPYFNRFVERFPSVGALAAAEEDEVLRLWQGLGYYSRARHMLSTAREVMTLYGGSFPSDYHKLIRLKGIGEYTASAIASISGNEPRAVVDGNVYRVLSRYFGIAEPVNTTKGKQIFREVSAAILNADFPGMHNQAIMEFGALCCTPRAPRCMDCPLSSDCRARREGSISELPKKIKKLKVRERFFTYIVYTDGYKVLMNKRDINDIWANMYDLPLLETSGAVASEDVTTLLRSTMGFDQQTRILHSSPLKKHLLTHQRIYARFVVVDRPPIKLEQKWFFTEVKNLKTLALPKIINIFITNFFNL